MGRDQRLVKAGLSPKISCLVRHYYFRVAGHLRINKRITPKEKDSANCPRERSKTHLTGRVTGVELVWFVCSLRFVGSLQIVWLWLVSFIAPAKSNNRSYYLHASSQTIQFRRVDTFFTGSVETRASFPTARMGLNRNSPSRLLETVVNAQRLPFTDIRLFRTSVSQSYTEGGFAAR